MTDDEHPSVDVLACTPNADRLVAACARGDYMDGSLVDVDLSDDEDYSEIMESVEVDDDIEASDPLEAKTRTFIRQLLRRGHFGPFEHPQITFAIEGISRSCMAQLTRHRHASFDVQSQRYVNFEDAEMITPDTFGEADNRINLHPDGYVKYDPDNEFGYDDGETITNWVMGEQVRLYKRLVDEGVPEEDARMVLPIGTKVNLSASFNLRSLMHVLDLRENMKAQHEAREVASAMREAAKEVAPITVEMYEEYTNNNSLRAP